MWARQSSRSLSPGTTTVPSGTAGGQGRHQQLVVSSCPTLRAQGLAAPCHPRPDPSLTGLLELLLIVMQSLVVMHADPAHPDP